MSKCTNQQKMTVIFSNDNNNHGIEYYYYIHQIVYVWDKAMLLIMLLQVSQLCLTDVHHVKECVSADAVMFKVEISL